jgi:hypothetical protein
MADNNRPNAEDQFEMNDLDTIPLDGTLTIEEELALLDAQEMRKIDRSVRYGIEHNVQKRWGLAIICCTYTSQTRWDVYVSLICKHIQQSLDLEKDSFLKDILSCPMIEDLQRLDGATWKEARARFDMKANPLGPTMYRQLEFKTPEEKLKDEIRRAPYWMLFVYADEASVASVVDTVIEPGEGSAEGDPWLTIVASALMESRSCFEDENGVMVEDCEGSVEDEFPKLYLKIRIDDLMHLYARVAGDEGIYTLDRQIPGDDGVCEQIY